MLAEYSGVRTEVVHEGCLDLPGSVVTIGAFDGVHLGHQSLIRKTVACARSLGTPSVVWTFDPPPKVFFAAVEQLSTLDDKLARIAMLSPDYIVVASFCDAYRRRTADDFIATLRRVNPAEIHLGEDFRFGARQAGDTALLGRHFAVRVFDPVRCASNEVISSSRIRGLRAEGRRPLADLAQGWSSPDRLLAGRLRLDRSRFGDVFDGQ